MFCPKCGRPHNEEDRFCSGCGFSLSAPQTVTAPKKGAYWPPILIMVLMLAISAVIYVATKGNLPVSSTASQTPWFVMNGDVLYFDESAYTGGSELIIPSTVDGQTVSAIGSHAFANCDFLTAIYLPDSLLEIHVGAFQNCTALRGINIPANVTKIGAQAFSGCTDLEAIHINNQIASIGNAAFDSCNSLLYIFYEGEYGQWLGLYDEFISPYTYVFCTNGTFPQGGIFP